MLAAENNKKVFLFMNVGVMKIALLIMKNLMRPAETTNPTNVSN